MDVRAGEIVGIAAVAGNGQGELAEVITGLRPATAGSVTIEGTEMANRPVAMAIRHGMAHVPEDRTGVGTAPNLSVADNLIMKRYRARPIARGWFVDDAAARGLAEDLKESYSIAAPSIDTEARLLSGGNIQRLIFAREIDTEPRVMVAVQPTRGLDVGAIEAVHRVLLERRKAGTAILLISEDLDEILALADRVDVMYEGRIVGSFPVPEADVGTLGELMTGGSDDGDGATASRPGRTPTGWRRPHHQAVGLDEPAPRTTHRCATLVQRRHDPCRPGGRAPRERVRHLARRRRPVRARSVTSSRRPSAAPASSATRWSRQHR